MRFYVCREVVVTNASIFLMLAFKFRYLLIIKHSIPPKRLGSCCEELHQCATAKKLSGCVMGWIKKIIAFSCGVTFFINTCEMSEVNGRQPSDSKHQHFTGGKARSILLHCEFYTKPKMPANTLTQTASLLFL